jgi:hypothetical protein
MQAKSKNMAKKMAQHSPKVLMKQGEFQKQSNKNEALPAPRGTVF